MGGHGHGEPYKIMDYRMYKVADAPEILAVQKGFGITKLKKLLAKKYNVWRYEKIQWGTPKQSIFLVWERYIKESGTLDTILLK